MENKIAFSKVYDICEVYFTENHEKRIDFIKIGFSLNKIMLQIKEFVSDVNYAENNGKFKAEDGYQLFINDRQLQKDASLIVVKKKQDSESEYFLVDLYYNFYEDLRLFDNIYFKDQSSSKQSFSVLTVKEYHQFSYKKPKFYGSFKLKELSHNILSQICFYLLPHESQNLFLSFKSISLNRVIQEPTIWRQYAKYLNFDVSKYDENINRETFFKLYRNRQLEFELEDCLSIYNESYQCKVKKIVFSQNNIKVYFRVQGDQSLGELQDPLHSKLWMNNKNLQVQKDYSNFKEVQNNQNSQVYEGIIAYRYPYDLNMTNTKHLYIDFEFGQAGYNQVEIFELSQQKLLKFKLFSFFQEKKYQNVFKFEELQQNILKHISSFLYHHESIKLLQTFKSPHLNKIFEDPSFWSYHSKCLAIQSVKEITSKEQFVASYKTRKLSFPLNNCVSEYNQNYKCDIPKISFYNQQIVIDFQVQGDNSLGPLQDPLQSQVFLSQYGGYLSLIILEQDSQFKEVNQEGKQIYIGQLKFKLEAKLEFNQQIYFMYGSAGFEAVHLLQLDKDAFNKLQLFNFV